jgi:hypothetical protein
MKLITVVSLIRQTSHYVDLVVRVDPDADRSRDADDPTLVARDFPFTWVRGGQHGLAPQVDEWFNQHPGWLASQALR